MISSLKFKTGYPTRLPGIRKRTLHFNDRLNVLLGPNGSGKSTILATLAQATGCGAGGWSDKEEPSALPYEALVEWDGWPVFYHDCNRHSDTSFLAPDYLENRRLLRSTGYDGICLEELGRAITFYNTEGDGAQRDIDQSR